MCSPGLSHNVIHHLFRQRLTLITTYLLIYLVSNLPTTRCLSRATPDDKLWPLCVLSSASKPRPRKCQASSWSLALVSQCAQVAADSNTVDTDRVRPTKPHVAQSGTTMSSRYSHCPSLSQPSIIPSTKGSNLPGVILMSVNRFPHQRDPRASSSLFDSYGGNSRPASRSPAPAGGYGYGGYSGSSYGDENAAGAGPGYRGGTPDKK